MIEAAVNLLAERQWPPGPPLERAGRPPSFTGTNEMTAKYQRRSMAVAQGGLA
jgi:hypothetical protein